MRRTAPLLFLAPLLVAASAPVRPVVEVVDVTLQHARAEARAADERVRRLEQVASRARDEASRLRARQAAAAEAIAAAEARISAADAEGRLIAAQLTSQRQRLQEERQPVASLVAGLATMARRPPLLALLGDAGTDEMVRVRLLLDATLPVIRRRSATLSAELAQGERLERAALTARKALAQNRDQLAKKKQAFAALEVEALETAERSGTVAIEAGDVALATGENAERIASEVESGRAATKLARELAALGPASLRPVAGTGRAAPIPFAYRLPVDARVLEGLGEISSSGVRSRGILLDTPTGAAIAAPASGIIRFSGPFRDYDGIIIIDHGGGWMSLVVNVASQLRPGTKVRIGNPLGRALGPLEVQLSRNGQHLSPALIAGSSATLSNKAKGG